MRRRAPLIATAALITGLSSIAVTSPVGGPIDSLHRLRDAVIGASTRFHKVPEILPGALVDDLNLHKDGIPLL
jgi:HAMP domain-containing protein